MSCYAQAGESVSPILQRLCRALIIAQETVQLLGAEGFPDPNGSGMNIRPEKIIGETAFLLLQAHTCSRYDEVRQLIDPLITTLLPYARHEKNAMEICLHPAIALEYAQAHICISRLGYPDARFDAILAKSIQSSAHQGKERPPHRMLEQTWIKETWQKGLTDIETNSLAIACSSLAQPLDLIHGTTDDFYAFTHALMYITNFTASPQALPRPAEVIAAEANALLARCILENDYDLAGELLLTWPLTGSPWSCAAIFSYHYLASREDEAGFLPMEPAHSKAYQQMQGEQRKKYRYATGYHTVYVMGLLCSVLLQQNNPPQNNSEDSNLQNGAARKIYPFLETEGDTPYWLQMIQQLPYANQDQMAALLFDLALLKSARQLRYDQVYTLLRLGYEMGLANTELANQAAELLERLALFGEKKKPETFAA